MNARRRSVNGVCDSLVALRSSAVCRKTFWQFPHVKAYSLTTEVIDLPTYLVTGAAGFIGSHLVNALLERGEKVRGIDNFSSGNINNLQGLDSADIIEGDINNAQLLQNIMKDVDYVFHQAAIPSVQRSVENPLATHNANINGTLSVLECARQNAKIKRIVYAASSSAYGNSPTLPKVETMPAMPVSPYAISKYTGELYAKVYSEMYGVECVALRYFNVFGPRQDPNSVYSAVIPRFILRMLQNESPTIYGDGGQSRDFTFISNVVSANLKAAHAKNVAGQMFNIATGERIRLLDVVDQLNRLLQKDIVPHFEAERVGDLRHSLADISRAQDSLGYTPDINFAEGLKHCVEWYQK